MKYQLYIIKKFYIPLEIDADSKEQAEEQAYTIAEANSEFDSDDTYIHFEGEI